MLSERGARYRELDAKFCRSADFLCLAGRLPAAYPAGGIARPERIVDSPIAGPESTPVSMSHNIGAIWRSLARHCTVSHGSQGCAEAPDIRRPEKTLLVEAVLMRMA